MAKNLKFGNQNYKLQCKINLKMEKKLKKPIELFNERIKLTINSQEKCKRKTWAFLGEFLKH